MSDDIRELVEWLRHRSNLSRFEDGELTYGGNQLRKAADLIERAALTQQEGKS